MTRTIKEIIGEAKKYIINILAVKKMIESIFYNSEWKKFHHSKIYRIQANRKNVLHNVEILQWKYNEV